MSEEIWKAIDGYKGFYEVSSWGRVRSLDRDIYKSDAVQRRRGRMKYQHTDSDGYRSVKLSLKGVDKTMRVHRLVACAFIPNDLCLPEVNHIDGDRANNYVDNLEWVTRLENIRDSINRGTHISLRDLSGENNPNYGNNKLSRFYAANPEVRKQKQSRRGAKNGRATPLKAYLPNGKIVEFDYIGECAQWLIDHNLCKGVKLSTLSTTIGQKLKSNKQYKNIFFSHII